MLWSVPLGIVSGGILGNIALLLAGGATFTDAWRSGIWKNSEKKSFLNISPMSWGIAMVLLFVIAFPAYILNRNKMATIQTNNGFFLVAILLGVLAILLTGMEFYNALAAS